MTEHCHPPSAFASLFPASSGFKILRIFEPLNPREGCYKFRGVLQKIFRKHHFFHNRFQGVAVYSKGQTANLVIEAPTTNAQWLTAARDLTDETTWKQLSETYRLPILKHCAKSGLTAPETEEVVQETFTQLAIQIGKASAPSEALSLRAWLTDVVNRHIIDHHKNNAIHRLPEKVQAMVQEWVESQDGSPSSPAERAEAESHLWALSLHRARSQVSAEHWQIFDAYAIQGLTSREVSELFNTSHFNVRIIAHRMKKMVRQTYNQLLKEEIHLP